MGQNTSFCRSEKFNYAPIARDRPLAYLAGRSRPCLGFSCFPENYLPARDSDFHFHAVFDGKRGT